MIVKKQKRLQQIVMWSLREAENGFEDCVPIELKLAKRIENQKVSNVGFRLTIRQAIERGCI